MAKLYWRVKKDGKWTWKPVIWIADEPVDQNGSRQIQVFNWRFDL